MQNGSKDYCYLDKIRINYGVEKCKKMFLEVCKKDVGEAIALLNDPRLTFPCFFILLPEVKSLRLGSSLSSRNNTVFNIIDQIQKRQNHKKGTDYLKTDKEAVYPILKWILETGCADDGFDNEYEEIMEITVSLLINVYKDESILPLTADMIFERNRNGHYIHDLVWAFFRSNSPDALKLIAERIRSTDQRDIDLACHLLNIEASISSRDTEDKQKKYQTYIRWLDENDRFLYFTGESFQFSSNPALYRVDTERKLKAGLEGAK